MSSELDDLIARFGRWLQNTGFDGGVNSPPVKAHDALLTLRAENELMREALEKSVKLIDALLCGRLASDMCNPETVKQAGAYIAEQGGTLAAVAYQQEMNRNALAQVAK